MRLLPLSVHHQCGQFLCCCDMQVHMYSMFGVQLQRNFSMGSEVQREGILQCQLHGNGLVVLTKGMQLWAVSGLDDPRPHKLASPRLKEAPSCMAIMQPHHTLSGCLEVRRACPHDTMKTGLDWINPEVVGHAHL